MVRVWVVGELRISYYIIELLSEELCGQGWSLFSFRCFGRVWAFVLFSCSLVSLLTVHFSNVSVYCHFASYYFQSCHTSFSLDTIFKRFYFEIKGPKLRNEESKSLHEIRCKCPSTWRRELLHLARTPKPVYNLKCRQLARPLVQDYLGLSRVIEL